jgi:DNA gyrase subunit A
MGVIREELAQILQQYGDARRTEIVESRIDFCREDLIPEEQVVLTVSQTGYAKTQPFPITKLNVVVVVVNLQPR